jgi:hypothetical protein
MLDKALHQASGVLNGLCGSVFSDNCGARRKGIRSRTVNH